MQRKHYLAVLVPALFLLSACETDTPAPEGSSSPAQSGINNVKTWSIQYEGKIVPRGKDYHVVDLYDCSDADLRALRASGSKPIAYFSSQYEKWRDDATDFPVEDLGRSLDGWPGEKWVNPKSSAVREIMRKRMRYAKARGFHGVDVDNVDFYLFRTGFDNSQAAALAYIRFLAAEAHRNGLRYSLKNATEVARQLSGTVDFYQNEQGIQYAETGVYRGIGKPVFNIEYRRPSRGVPGIYTIYKKGAVMDAREEVIWP